MKKLAKILVAAQLLLLSACASNVNAHKQLVPPQPSKLIPQTVALSGKFAGNNISASTFYSWGLHPIWVPIYLENKAGNWSFYKTDDGNLSNKNLEKIYYAYQEKTFYLGVVPLAEINTFDGSPKDYVYNCEIEGGTRRVDEYDICASNFSISVGERYRRMDRDAIATALNSLSDADINQMLDYISKYISNEKEYMARRQKSIAPYLAEQDHKNRAAQLALDKKNKDAIAEKNILDAQRKMQFVKNMQTGDLVCNITTDIIGDTLIIGAHVEAVSATKAKVSIAFLKSQSKNFQTTFKLDAVNLASGETIKDGTLTWMDLSSLDACN